MRIICAANFAIGLSALAATSALEPRVTCSGNTTRNDAVYDAASDDVDFLQVVVKEDVVQRLSRRETASAEPSPPLQQSVKRAVSPASASGNLRGAAGSTPVGRAVSSGQNTLVRSRAPTLPDLANVTIETESPASGTTEVEEIPIAASPQTTGVAKASQPNRHARNPSFRSLSANVPASELLGKRCIGAQHAVLAVGVLAAAALSLHLLPDKRRGAAAEMGLCKDCPSLGVPELPPAELPLKLQKPQKQQKPQPCGTSPGPKETPLLPMPMPAPRLRRVGASYVLPLSQITSCKTAPVFGFRIPTLPSALPLRAILRRDGSSGAWLRADIVVEESLWGQLPPLLSCTAQGQDPHRSGVRQFNIVNNSNTLVATLLAQDRLCVVERHKQGSWNLEVHVDGRDFWVGVFQQGEKIGQATSFKQGASQVSEYMQVDTQNDLQSPESALMLLCFLAVIVFQIQTPESV